LIPIPPETNDSPHAIWWEYDDEKYLKEDQWGNPTVEIIGYLLRYENNFDSVELEKLKNIALRRLFDADTLEIHELMCYIRFAKSFKKNILEKINLKIIEIAHKLIEKDTSKWNTYVGRPLQLINSPTSPLFRQFKEITEFELDYLIENFDEENAWQPNWDWRIFEKDFNKLKPQIAGMITVNNLIILKNFGRIE